VRADLVPATPSVEVGVTEKSNRYKEVTPVTPVTLKKVETLGRCIPLDSPRFVYLE